MSTFGDYLPSYRPVTEGPAARRPRASDFGRGLWFDEAGNLYHSDGAAWTLVNGGLRAGVPQSGDYLDPDTAGISTTAVGIGFLRASPMVIANELTLATIGIEVTTAAGAGGVIRLGLYADNGQGFPGALVFEAPTVIDATVAGFTEIVVNRPMMPGLYWPAGLAQVAAVTVRSVNQLIMPSHWRSGTDISQGGYLASGLTVGPLPAQFPAGATPAGAAHRVMFKVA